MPAAIALMRNCVSFFPKGVRGVNSSTSIAKATKVTWKLYRLSATGESKSIQVPVANPGLRIQRWERLACGADGREQEGANVTP
jgi:hypothetical protein